MALTRAVHSWSARVFFSRRVERRAAMVRLVVALPPGTGDKVPGFGQPARRPYAVAVVPAPRRDPQVSAEIADRLRLVPLHHNQRRQPLLILRGDRRLDLLVQESLKADRLDQRFQQMLGTVEMIGSKGCHQLAPD